MEEKLNGRYQLNNVLGEGGMAVVYEATDTLLNRPVAVKVLKEEYASSKEFVNRIKREARSVARLSHPHIVNVYDMGEEEGRPYLVMERVAGKNLKKYIEENGPLSSRLALKIAEQISSALTKAHENDIVHCDIKPHNILITDNNRVKVTDFGIARALNSSRNSALSGSIEGSAHYLSPEQARGEEVKPATDIYSLGIVLYEMITGDVPYTGDTAISVAVQHARSPIPDLKQTELPIEVADIIEKTLAKDPEDRFSSAAELKVTLEKAAKSNFAEKNALISGESEENSEKKSGSEEHESRRNFSYLSPAWEKTAGKLPAGVRYISVFVLIMAFLGGSLLIAYNIFMDVPVVEVPDVVGMNVEDAGKELSQAGLNYELSEEKINHPDISSGHIARQEPGEGTSVRQTRDIKIYLSGGPEEGVVPDVSGLNEREAVIELENSGYNVGDMEYQFSDLYGQDRIITTEPEPGSELPYNEDVDLIISMGYDPTLLEVPGIIGVEWRKAQELLRDYNLRLGGVTEEENIRLPAGKIIEQSPRAGEKVSAGRSVDVKISSGPDDDMKEEVLDRRVVSFSAAGEERAEYRVIMDDDLGRDMVWNSFMNPEEEADIEVYSSGEVRFQILREEEVIYDRVFE